MFFDKKKLASIIVAPSNGVGKETKDGDEKDDDYGKEGLEMAMTKIMDSMKAGESFKASEALGEWLKMHRSYEENNMKPEKKEEA